MQNEIAITTNGLAKIDFVGYDAMLEDVTKLSEAMKTMEVTEETIKDNKKLLAKVRKQVAELDAERKKVKSEIMTPYDELNEKINNIKAVLGEGERHIQAQIYEFTEAERATRYDNIKELFLKYQTSYNAPQWLTYDKFISQNPTLITNKATSAKTIRTKIVEYFEKFKADYAQLKSEIPEKEERSAVLIAYAKNGFNMQEAIIDYLQMIAEKQRLASEQTRVKATKVPDIVIITGNENIDEKPLDKEIEYVRIKVTRDTLARMDKLDFEYWEA